MSNWETKSTAAPVKYFSSTSCQGWCRPFRDSEVFLVAGMQMQWLVHFSAPSVWRRNVGGMVRLEHVLGHLSVSLPLVR
jgi:hypothetical protein